MHTPPEDQQNSQGTLKYENVDDRTFLLNDKSTKSRFYAYKNLMVLSVTFLLLYTAYDSMKNLQSSLNTNDDVGVKALAVVHGCFALSSAFLAYPMIGLFGYKWTVVVSLIPFLLYMMVNYYPQAYLMYPAAVMVGLASGSLWPTGLSYVTALSSTYAHTRSINDDTAATKFISIFYMCYQTAQIWGNLISFLILTPQQQIYTENMTVFTNSVEYTQCGVAFDQRKYHLMETMSPVDERTFHILCLVYTGLCALAILLVLVLLESTHSSSSETVFASIKTSTKLILSIFKQHQNITQLLIIPLSIWTGAEQSFFSGWFTKAFVTCTLNPKYIGLVYVTFGVSSSIASLTISFWTKCFGYCSTMTVAAIINYSVILFMFVWQPKKNELIILCLIGGLWGISEAVWITQTTMLYSMLFPDQKEAGLSSYCFWDAIGFMIFYLMMPHCRTDVALISLSVMLSLGMCGYAVIKYRGTKV